jgi:hypothetical protein
MIAICPNCKQAVELPDAKLEYVAFQDILRALRVGRNTLNRKKPRYRDFPRPAFHLTNSRDTRRKTPFYSRAEVLDWVRRHGIVEGQSEAIGGAAAAALLDQALP